MERVVADLNPPRLRKDIGCVSVPRSCPFLKNQAYFFRKRGKKGTLLKKVLIRRAFEEAFLKNRETFLRRVGRCSVRVNEDHRGVQRISQSNTEKTARMECAGPKGQPFHDHGTPLRATDKAPGKAKPSSL